MMYNGDGKYYKWNNGTGWNLASGSTGATLSNVGSGYRLVKTAAGQLKTLFVGYGLLADSSSNTDGITFKADTSSANHLVTQNDLNDAIGAGTLDDVLARGFKGFNKDIELHDNKTSQAVIAVYNRDTTDDNAVARVDARAYRGKAVLTCQGGSHAFNGLQIYRYNQYPGTYVQIDSAKTFELLQNPDTYSVPQLRNGLQLAFVHPNYDKKLLSFDTMARAGFSTVQDPQAWIDLPPDNGSGTASLRLRPGSFSANTDAGAINNTGTYLTYTDNSHGVWNLNDQCRNAPDGSYSAPSHSFANAHDVGLSYNSSIDANVLSTNGVGETVAIVNANSSGYSAFTFYNSTLTSANAFCGYNNANTRFRIGANSGFSIDFEAGGFNDNDPTMRLTSSGGVYMKTLVGTGSRVIVTDASGNLSALSSGTSGQALVSNGTSAASFQTLVLKGTTTWDPPSVGANSSTSTSFTVTGAALGDPVTVSKVSGSYSNGEVYFAYVSATNTVTIQLQNASGGSFNITSDDYHVVVLKY